MPERKSCERHCNNFPQKYTWNYISLVRNIEPSIIRSAFMLTVPSRVNQPADNATSIELSQNSSAIVGVSAVAQAAIVVGGYSDRQPSSGHCVSRGKRRAGHCCDSESVLGGWRCSRLRRKRIGCAWRSKWKLCCCDWRCGVKC